MRHRGSSHTSRHQLPSKCLRRPQFPSSEMEAPQNKPRPPSEVLFRCRCQMEQNLQALVLEVAV